METPPGERTCTEEESGQWASACEPWLPAWGMPLATQLGPHPPPMVPPAPPDPASSARKTCGECQPCQEARCVPCGKSLPAQGPCHSVGSCGLLPTKGRAGGLRWGPGAQVYPQLPVPLTPPCSLLSQCPPGPSLWSPGMTPQAQEAKAEAGRSKRTHGFHRWPARAPHPAGQSLSGPGSPHSRSPRVRGP